MASGELKKMEIKVFTDPDLKNAASPDSVKVRINPQEYSVVEMQTYNETQTINERDIVPKRAGKEPDVLSFKFWYDCTGAFRDFPADTDPDGKGVAPELDKLRSALFNKDTKASNYLVILWGTLNFQCVVTAFTINYLLFKPNGAPLRASVDISFKKFGEPKEIAAEKSPSGPETTKSRTVVEGDSLALMCAAIYGSSKYYLEVAKANNLSSFRKLAPGQKITFPPIQ